MCLLEAAEEETLVPGEGASPDEPTTVSATLDAAAKTRRS
jgi:hypothetical protein